MPDFSVDQILGWADAHHQRTGQWPHTDAGPVEEAAGESWCAVDSALIRGSRGCPGGFSLAELLSRERGVRNPGNVPKLTPKQILAWADAHYRRTSRWPTVDGGPIPEAPGENWQALDAALRCGTRGLRGGTSLPRLLTRYRGRRNHLDLPPLSKKRILAWADAHFQRTGKWPNRNSGPVQEAPDENWSAINQALEKGVRGLPPGSSLPKLLAKKRGVRNPAQLPPLTDEQIVEWARHHRERTGSWPTRQSGPIVDAPQETWSGVAWALRLGKRGLAGGRALRALLKTVETSASKSSAMRPNQR
jgi:hypothetical protein